MFALFVPLISTTLERHQCAWPQHILLHHLAFVVFITTTSYVYYGNLPSLRTTPFFCWFFLPLYFIIIHSLFLLLLIGLRSPLRTTISTTLFFFFSSLLLLLLLSPHQIIYTTNYSHHLITMNRFTPSLIATKQNHTRYHQPKKQEQT